MTAPLAHLLDRWDADPAFRALLSRGGDGLVLPDAARPYLVAGVARALEQAVLVVVPSDADAESLAAATAEFCEQTAELRAWDVLPYEGMSPDPRIAARRVQALRLLRAGSGPRVVVASVRGFIQKPAPGASSQEPLRLAKGATVDRDQVLARLVELGYAREDVAAEAGTFAVRGGIVDVFPATANRAVRVELFGDEVDALRWVDPDSQRSVEAVSEAWVVARTELPPTPEVRDRARLAYETLKASRRDEEVADKLARLASAALPDGVESLLPWLWDDRDDVLHRLAPDACTVIVFDPKRTADEAARAVEQEEELAALWSDPARLEQPEERVERGKSKAGARPPREEERLLYLPLDRVLDGFRARGAEVWEMGAFAAGADVEPFEIVAQAWDASVGPRALLERCRELRAEGWETVFCALPNEVPVVGTRLAEENLGGAPVVASGLRGGFTMPALQLAIVTHTEWHARPPAPTARPRRRTPRALAELRPGDLVVHVLHGIGRYVGMETRDVQGFTREYLVVEYAGGDRLFVPSDASESLTRYIGSEGPKLSRLGTADWERTKTRVRKKARDIAAELIRIYSARLHSPGYAYAPDSPWQRELEESFPYDETPDQLSAIQDVYRDMARPAPMDRLVCGDVGFGKTEVAVRAAFKAVTEGKQVAVLVPTTLLAQQHYVTFSERFRPFPVTVAMLSRFVSAAESEDVLATMTSGGVDVVVGTHRLIGKDVRFRDLGLVIIDEEHRFGVSQKEYLKRLRVEVDVLTLTATPIPRTLEMSMSGVRDLSIMETPPLARRPIRTFVGPQDERLITAAIRRELARGGQIFYVHNRVQTIERERRRLERIIPEARIGVGHGQMDEDALERVMLRFWDKELDVLLCTTIIEAGLDIPTVNTLVVDHADKLGLAQLYQLRGRVGRAGEQAYAYLFYPANQRLTETAHERLKTLAQHTELGAGMAIALKDLEIRGAGNLLGAEQHGQIEAVGFEMYVQLLEEAARELKGETVTPPPAEVRIDLPVDAYLPAEYVDREPLRLAAYRRIAEAATVSDVEEARSELRDRYGPLPAPAEALLAVAGLKGLLRSIGVRELTVVPHELHGRVAKVRPVTFTTEWQQLRLRRKYPRAVVSSATSTLILPVPDLDGLALVDWLADALRGLLASDTVAS